MWRGGGGAPASTSPRPGGTRHAEVERRRAATPTAPAPPRSRQLATSCTYYVAVRALATYGQSRTLATVAAKNRTCQGLFNDRRVIAASAVSAASALPPFLNQRT